MAKKTSITIASIVAAGAILMVVVNLGSKLFDSGGDHAAQAVQVSINQQDIAYIKPLVIEHDKEIAVMKEKQTQIYDGVLKIQRKMNIE